ncbi:DoxX family protein [Aliishimia ponticola]|uniref:DoxX family protein n=1 Tax=Aliishimia ponticola TaxID=2499833 RepID=A0A4S4N956_9RHOB|nr:DoxX family protein [Aliishimia ponticola]THH35774.1 DoxX family protein [Aliishimia ponticola]
MRVLITAHNDIFDRLERVPSLLPTLARVVFALVFLMYFLNSAMTKVDGSIFTPSFNAFAQILPKAAEAVSYDTSQLTGLQSLIIVAGTIGEFVLPVLVVIGLLTRLAALGMIGFVAVQTLVDVTGHGAALGGWLDNTVGLLDQRTLWVFLFAVIVITGPGKLSVDRLLGLR